MNLKTAFAYLNYKLSAFTEHDVHSPFVYRFYMDLIASAKTDPVLDHLRLLRRKLSEDPTSLEITDLGAGSRKLGSTRRKISDIVKHGIAPRKQAEFLYRYVSLFSPQTVIELGTSVGLTTLYLAKGVTSARVYTIEGCPNLSAFARNLFAEETAASIIPLNGNFDQVLPEVLAQVEKPDLAYIDGNHAYEPTMRYFQMLLDKKHPGLVIVFDDISWSEGMARAWREIHMHPEVRLSMDFFHFGMVFFRTESLSKEHFVLKF